MIPAVILKLQLRTKRLQGRMRSFAFLFLLSESMPDRKVPACLYGLGYPRQPSSRDNFTERLYENCVTKTKLTLLNYAYILRRIFKV